MPNQHDGIYTHEKGCLIKKNEAAFTMKLQIKEPEKCRNHCCTKYISMI